MSGDRSIPNVYCIDDGWMINEFGAAGDVDLPFWCNFWRANWGPAPLRPVVRRCLAPFEHQLMKRRIPTQAFGVPFGHVCFISEFWRTLHRRAGLDVSASDVIYGGVAPEAFFVQRSADAYADGPLRLLYAGYVNRSRGLHTIIEALGLMSPAERTRMHLSIAYGGPLVADEYVESIHARIAELGLSSHVTFLGRVPHVDMPAVYAAHHALVFASMRNEGMPMVMMEAMYAGCAVPNTGSGGAIELAERAGTPLFPKGDPLALSRLLVALEQDRARLAEIALRGQQTVLRDFTIGRMLKATEAVLARCAAPRPVPEAPIMAPV
jgi:glycosyltransferase involved in cell wall biosynthesis